MFARNGEKLLGPHLEPRIGTNLWLMESEDSELYFSFREVLDLESVFLSQQRTVYWFIKQHAT